MHLFMKRCMYRDKSTQKIDICRTKLLSFVKSQHIIEYRTVGFLAMAIVIRQFTL